MPSKGNGHVIPNTPIAVDMWDWKQTKEVKFFFLTHLHADHIIGLKNTFPYPIYTSPLNRKLLKVVIVPCNFKVCELQPGITYTIHYDTDSEEAFEVTPIDANHCPGAVMFHFKGYFGSILYSGDMRYKRGIMSNLDILPIDYLYLDNTYASKECEFPEQEKILSQVLSHVEECLAGGKKIVFGLDNLGKEEILEAIYIRTKQKIHVSGKRKDILKAIDLSHIIEDIEERANVFVVSSSKVTSKYIKNWNNASQIEAVLLTAKYSATKAFTKCPNICVFPYSLHSSYSELQEFIKVIKPKCLIPIVSSDVKGIFGADVSNRADMKQFQKYLCLEQCAGLTPPSAALKVMKCSPPVLKTKGRFLSNKSRIKHCPEGVVFESMNTKQNDNEKQNVAAPKEDLDKPTKDFNNVQHVNQDDVSKSKPTENSNSEHHINQNVESKSRSTKTSNSVQHTSQTVKSKSMSTENSNTGQHKSQNVESKLSKEATVPFGPKHSSCEQENVGLKVGESALISNSQKDNSDSEIFFTCDLHPNMNKRFTEIHSVSVAFDDSSSSQELFVTPDEGQSPAIPDKELGKFELSNSVKNFETFNVKCNKENVCHNIPSKTKNPKDNSDKFYQITCIYGNGNVQHKYVSESGRIVEMAEKHQTS